MSDSKQGPGSITMRISAKHFAETGEHLPLRPIVMPIDGKNGISIHIRSDFDGLGYIEMDWGPMFMFGLVFGAFFVRVPELCTSMVCDVSGRLAFLRSGSLQF